MITVIGDLLDADLLDELFAEHHFDAVLHLAALPGVRRSIHDPGRYLRVNAEGTAPTERSVAPADALENDRGPDRFDDYTRLTGWTPFD